MSSHDADLKMNRLLILILLVVLTASACSQRPSSAPILTDRQVYRAEDEAISINTVYTNSTDSTVEIAISGCKFPTFTLERDTDGQWIRTGAPICPAILYPPVQVAPREQLESSLRIFLEQIQAPVLEGTYRLVFEIRRPGEGEPLSGDLLPLESRVSNEFRITE